MDSIVVDVIYPAPGRELQWPGVSKIRPQCVPPGRGYFGIRAFTGSLTFSTLSNATFCGSPFTFSTLRM